MGKLWNKHNKQLLGATAVVIVGISFWFLLMHLGTFKTWTSRVTQIMSPFVIGGVVAYILDPMCDKLYTFFLNRFRKSRMKEKHQTGLAKALSILLSLLLILVLFVVVMLLVIPQLIDSVTALVSAVPGYANDIYDKVLPHLEGTELETWFRSLDLVSTARNWVSNTFIPNADTIVATVTAQVGNVVKVFYNLIVGFIVSFYCLSNRSTFALQGKKFIFAVFPFKWAEEILNRLRFANNAFNGFISGKMLDSLIIGIIAFFVCMLLRMPYYPLLAVVIGITNIIPFFGPIIGAVPCVLLILIVSPIKALYFIIFVILLQQFDGNILGPHILSSSVGVSGFWILFAIMLFGGLFGVVGMVIGTPLFAVIYSIVRDWVNASLKKKDLPQEAWNYRDLDAFEETYRAASAEEMTVSYLAGLDPSDEIPAQVLDEEKTPSEK